MPMPVDMEFESTYSAFSESLPDLSVEEERIPPLLIKKTGENEFQTVDKQPPDLKINIHAANNNPIRSLVPYELTTTHADGSSMSSKVLVPVKDAQKYQKQFTLEAEKAEMNKQQASREGEKSKKKNQQFTREAKKPKKKKLSAWRWIYIKQMEPSKRVITSVHRFSDDPTILNKTLGKNFLALESMPK